MNQQNIKHTPIEITAAQLPLYCPNPNMSLWSTHPRVFLPIEKNGVAVCPYCGTEYRLVSDTKA